MPNQQQDTEQQNNPLQSVNYQQESNAHQQEGNKKKNNTGIPDKLKAVVEHISGFSLDEVRVHYNSEKPAELGAHAYTEGFDIYIAPGQEKHLAHELWHVVQQLKGEVKPNKEIGGVKANTEQGLEKDAGNMGDKAQKTKEPETLDTPLQEASIATETAQFVLKYGDEQFKNKRELAKNGDAFKAFLSSKDSDKNSKLDDPNKVYDLKDGLKLTNADVYESKEEQIGDDGADAGLKEKLDIIAKKYLGERCHECATEMQDAFFGRSKVLEIYTEDGDTKIKVMGSIVRNHYVNLYQGLVYDSGTGSNGVKLADYMTALGEDNPEKELKYKEAEES